MKRTLTAASLAVIMISALAAGVGPANADVPGPAAGESLVDYVVVNTAPTLVAGGLQFDGPTAGGVAVNAFHPEQTPLSSVTELGYDVAVAPGDGQADPAYALQVNTTDGGATVTLSAEPMQNGLPVNAAGNFDVTSWKFWSSGTAASDDGGQQNPEPLSWFEAQYPSAVVVGHGIQLAAGATGTVAIVSSTSFNGASSDFTLGTQPNPIPVQSAPTGGTEAGAATVTGIDSDTGFGTQHDPYTVGSAFGPVFYDVQTSAVKDPQAIVGLSAPVIVQPQGTVVAEKGTFVWHQTAEGSVTVPPIDGGTWTIDNVPAATGQPIAVANGSHDIILTADPGRKIYRADIPRDLHVASRLPITRLGTPVTMAPPSTVGQTAQVLVSSAVTVSGVSQVGKPLTVNVGPSNPSDAKVSYQWFVNSLNKRSAIASGGTGKTFTPSSAAYVGKWITVAVTFSYPGYHSYWEPVGPADFLVKAGTLMSAVPGISGTPKVGNRLSAVPGEWTPGASFAYQWYANGKAIAGERSSVLNVGAAQYGAKIGLRITGTKSGYTTVVRTSSTTAAVGAGKVVGPVPTISMTENADGAPLVGATLNAHVGSWTPGVSLRYQWYRDNTPIVGATKSAYTIPGSGLGHAFHVAVKGVETDCTPLTRISAATLKTLPATTSILMSAVPGISGTPKVGNRLSAVPGEWTPGASFAYQWYANGKAIAGERSSVLNVGAAQYGAKIGLRITGTKSGYTTVVRSSQATAAVAIGTLVGADPTIGMTTSAAGAPLVGGTLNAHVASWTAGTSFLYQWYRDASPIPGATSSAYEVPASALGHVFHVAIKGSKSGYTSLTKISAATLKTLQPRSYYEARSGNKTTFRIIVSGLTPSSAWDGYPGTVDITTYAYPSAVEHTFPTVTGVTPYTKVITLTNTPRSWRVMSINAWGGMVYYPFVFPSAKVLVDEKPAGAPDNYYARYKTQTDQGGMGVRVDVFHGG